MSRHYKVADLRPHPVLSLLVPPLAADEYDALKADIAEHKRVYSPLLLAHMDGGIVVLDGHHRLRIAVELGMTEVPGDLLEGLSEDEKVERGLVANTARRSMTREQKRALVESLVKRWPDKPALQIAKLAGVSHHTVIAARADLEAAGDVGNLPTRTDSLGREQPAHKAPRDPKILPLRKDGSLDKLAALRAQRESQAAIPPAKHAPTQPPAAGADGTAEPVPAENPLEVATPAPSVSAPARNDRVMPRRTVPSRLRDLVSAALSASDITDADIDALGANDLMLDGLDKARAVLDRVIQRLRKENVRVHSA